MSKKNGTAAAVEQLPWGGYINLRLAENELEEFDRQCKTKGVTLEGCLTELVKHGKVSVNERDGSFYATLTVPYAGKLWGLSAFAGDPIEAVKLLAFKRALYPDWMVKTPSARVSLRG
jgi:hypothetical protein